MTKNKLSKHLMALTVILFLGISANAQMKVGDNPTTISANSALEIESTNKGVLLPRLGLSATTNVAPLSAHIAGMVVYNTATAGDVTPGFYYNDGTKWVRLFSASAASNTTAANNLVTIANGTGATLTAMTIGVDTAQLKTFLNNKITVTANAPLTGNGTSANPLGITQNNTSAVPGQFITITNGTGATLTAMTLGIDTTALKTFINGRTTNTLTSSVNTMTNTTNGIVATAPIVNSNTLTAASNAITNTTNGVAATLTPAAGTLTTKFLGFDAAGNLVTDTAITVIPATTNTLTNPTNTITSTVNGVVATAPAVNTVANSSSVNTLSTTVNGVTGAGVNIINNLAISNPTSNTIRTTVNGVATPTDATIIATNTLTAASNAITNTTNGVAATLTPAAGTLTTKFLGFDAAGNLVTDTAITVIPATTVSNTSSANNLSTTVNGVTGTAVPMVNSISNTFVAATRALTTTVNGIASTAVTLTDGPDSTTASNGLTMTGKDVRLGGALTAATSITTTATNTLALAGLQSGVAADSILVANATSGVVARRSAAAILAGATTNTLTAASNAITNTTNGVAGTLTPAAGTLTTKFLGFDAAGNLVTDTAITVIPATTNTLTNPTNTITSTVNGVVATAPAVNTVANSSSVNTLSTTVNGVTGAGVNIINNLAISNPTTNTIRTNVNGVITPTDATIIASNTLTAASNAITNTTNGVAATLTPAAGTLTTKFLGFDAAGNLVTDTAITIIPATTVSNTSTANNLSTTVNGVTGATVPMVNSISNTFVASTRSLTTTVNGVASAAVTLTDGPDSTTASNGMTMTGKDVRLGGALTGATSITTTATNTLALAGLQSGVAADSILVANATSGVVARRSPASILSGATTNTLTAASNAITNTTNGVAATLTPAAGTLTTKFLGFDAAGNLVTDTAFTATTNTLTNPTNTITSTVNGIVATTTAVNTVSNNFTAATRALTTTVNGVAGTAVTIPHGPDSTLANNGLTLSGDTVQLGGTLTKPTVLTTSATNTLALAGLQSGATTDSMLVLNPTNNIVRRISAGKFKNGNLLVTTSAALTVADSIDVIIFRGTAVSTITLPAAASNIGKVLRILNYAASATNIDITLSPAPVIQGGTTNVTNAIISSQLKLYGSNAASALGNTIEVVSDGTNWYKLGN